MVHVTPQARDYLLKLIEEANLRHPAMALRLVVGLPGRLGLLPGVRNSGDHVVLSRGQAILLLDPSVASALDHATLDTQRGPAGGLVVRPPRPRAPSVGRPRDRGPGGTTPHATEVTQ